MRVGGEEVSGRGGRWEEEGVAEVREAEGEVGSNLRKGRYETRSSRKERKRVHHNVLRLDVCMQNSLRMTPLHCTAHLPSPLDPPRFVHLIGVAPGEREDMAKGAVLEDEVDLRFGSGEEG